VMMLQSPEFRQLVARLARPDKTLTGSRR